MFCIFCFPQVIEIINWEEEAHWRNNRSSSSSSSSLSCVAATREFIIIIIIGSIFYVVVVNVFIFVVSQERKRNNDAIIVVIQTCFDLISFFCWHFYYLGFQLISWAQIGERAKEMMDSLLLLLLLRVAVTGHVEMYSVILSPCFSWLLSQTPGLNHAATQKKKE